METEKTVEGIQTKREGKSSIAAVFAVAAMFLAVDASASTGVSYTHSAAESINVVSIGAKNDGSEDVSAIVNANTSRGPLFFPAGIYKVSHPLVLKNSIRGEGYSRVPRVGAMGTWLVSDIAATNATHGVVEFGDGAVNVENLNIKCFSRECGIRIYTKGWNTLTFIDKVGVFGVESYSLFAQGPGSRRVFAQNMTIFGTSRDLDARSVGIRIAGFVDCRISNIEIMGVCRGIELFNEHTYGDNLHVWTGIDGKFGGEWWHDTRSIVLGERAHFSGSQIYPDTSYYAFDLGANSLCEIANVMYWEDDSVKKVQDRTGRFVHHADASRPGCLSVTGGLVGAGGDDKTPGATATYYASEATFRDVSLLSNYAIKGANIDRLCLGRNLPDYTVRYADKGWCKVADVVTVAKTGSCAAILSLGDGAAWRIGVLKGDSCKVEFSAKPLNPLCGTREIAMVEEEGVAKVFIRCDTATPIEARFATTCMCDRFRPLDHSSLRDKNKRPRYRDVRERLVK